VECGGYGPEDLVIYGLDKGINCRTIVGLVLKERLVGLAKTFMAGAVLSFFGCVSYISFVDSVAEVAGSSPFLEWPSQV
jgi:hypothetical protein